MDRHLTVREAARELGVSTRTVERRIAIGRLESVVEGGRRLVVAHPGWDSDTDSDTPTDNADTVSAPDERAAWAMADRRRWSDNADRQTDNPDTDTADRADAAHAATVRDLQLRLMDAEARAAGAEERELRLIDAVREQSQTIRVLTIRVAQLEGRMLDAEAAPEAPAEPPRPAEVPAPHPRARGASGRSTRRGGGGDGTTSCVRHPPRRVHARTYVARLMNP